MMILIGGSGVLPPKEPPLDELAAEINVAAKRKVASVHLE
jgi:hypothetical protein